MNNVNIEEAWRSENYKALRKRHLEKELEGLICHNCMNNCNDKFQPLDSQYYRAFKEPKSLNKIIGKYDNE